MSDTPPFPALADRAAGDYNAMAYAFGTHMAGKFNSELAAVAANVHNNATEALESAEAAAESAEAAAEDAASAARDAATAASAPGTNATSTTSMVLGLGTKTFTLAQTGKLFGKGNTVTIAAPTGDNWMAGSITAFNSATGEMTVNVTNISGSGTFADWRISLSGAAGLTGVVNELRANNIASASTVNLTAATGNLVHITGTTTISAFTLTSGAERSVIFDSALTLTHSAGLLLPGGANIAVAPGDRALVRGDSNGAVVTHYQRASGGPVIGGVISKEYLSPDQVITAGGTLTIAHGLGVKPKIVQGFLRCITAQTIGVGLNAQPGDVAVAQLGHSTGGTSTTQNGCLISCDDANIYVYFINQSNGDPFRSFISANWRFFIEAFA